MGRRFEQSATILEQPPQSPRTASGSSRSQPSGWLEDKSPVSSTRRESWSAGSLGQKWVRPRPISRTQAMHIASQLSVMVDTGVTLPEALGCLAQQSDKPHIRQALKGIQEKVKGGTDLSMAVARCPYRFPRIFPYLLRASEASGTMGPMLSRVAEYLEEEIETLSKVRSAMIYPAVMLTMALGTVVLMFTFLLPRFGVIYQGHEDVLPLPTRIAFGASKFVTGNWIYIVAVLVSLTTGLIIYLRSERGRLAIDWLKLHMPLLGRMFTSFYLARSVRTIGTMIASGRTVPEALNLAQGISGNSYFSELWHQAHEFVQVGQQISDPLFNSPLVPNSVAQMIATGEKTGRLAQVMERISAFCESDLQATVKNVTSILEPLMILIMGLIVAGVATSILLPIFSISKIVGSG